MLQQSLSIHDFADRKFEVAPAHVSSVLVDGERVWVTIEAQPGVHFTMLEVKNTEDVTAWGSQTEKLEDFVNYSALKQRSLEETTSSN